MQDLKANPVFTILAAVMTRLVLILHTFIVVWNVYTDKMDDPYYWLLLTLVIPMIIELVVVVVKNKGHEWNSVFCPSLFLYLANVLPSIWIMETEEISNLKNNVTGLNKTFQVTFGVTEQPVFVLTLTTGVWLMAMEQSMVFLLILARWLLPTGHMTYGQLSNVLLLYIGTLADILELLEMFQLDGAVENWNFVYAVLSVFSLGLLQFTMVIVESPAQEEEKERLLPKGREGDTEGWTFMPKHVRLEVAQIMQSVVLMHVPVIAIRITAIVIYGIGMYSNIFFLIKNCLMFILSVNRLVILCCFTKPKYD